MADLYGARWVKSTFSMASGNCVETARLAAHQMAVRDSKDRSGPVLVFTASEWRAFVAGVRDGQFDLPEV